MEKEKHNSFINSVDTYLLNTYYGLGTTQGPRGMAAIQSDKVPAFKKLIF